MAQEREVFRESLRLLSTPYAPVGGGLAPPMIRPEGLANALGIMRTLSRMVKKAARMEALSLQVFGACYGCLVEYNLPSSRAIVAPVASKAAPPVSAQPQRTSKPDDVVPGHSKAARPPESESKYRVLGALGSARDRISETPRQSGKSDDHRRRPRSRSRAK